ncbi:MAG: hypothetical protein M3Y91_17145 [Actinomycetota bacterium]|nr:hypothetical protein [Actinomycetota bacterium]
MAVEEDGLLGDVVALAPPPQPAASHDTLTTAATVINLRGPRALSA